MRSSQTVKKNFDSLVDGGTVPPPRPPLYMFQSRPLGTTEKCKEAIFPSENRIFLRKNRCGRAVHAAATDGISVLLKFSDKQRGAQEYALLFRFILQRSVQNHQPRLPKWPMSADGFGCGCGHGPREGKNVIRELLKASTVFMAQVHSYLLEINDIFALHLDDKQLHFVVMAVIGMMLFFVVHYVFVRLAKWSITAVSFIYVFTVMTVLGFGVEIGQGVTGTGSMDFGDAAAGLYGVLVFFVVYSVYRLIVYGCGRVFRKKRKK